MRENQRDVQEHGLLHAEPHEAGKLRFRLPVLNPINTINPPKGIAFSSATNGANGNKGSAIKGKSLMTYWPNGIASDMGSK